MLIPADTKTMIGMIYSRFGEAACFNDQTFYFTGIPYTTDVKAVVSVSSDNHSSTRTVGYISSQKGENKGYIRYNADIVNNCIKDFSVLTKDTSVSVLKDAAAELERLLKIYNKVEWTLVKGNKAEKMCDRLCGKYGGSKSILHDYYKDEYGNYHDKLIYEVMGGALC